MKIVSCVHEKSMENDGGREFPRLRKSIFYIRVRKPSSSRRSRRFCVLYGKLSAQGTLPLLQRQE